MKSPAASRAALNRHRGFINPELVKILETVGGYDIEVIHTDLILNSATLRNTSSRLAPCFSAISMIGKDFSLLTLPVSFGAQT